MDAVTGRLSGVEILCIYQCHIRASAGRVMSVYLDIMISPGVCTALPPDTHSGTITYGLISCEVHQQENRSVCGSQCRNSVLLQRL